jgi:predicted DNA-binding protein
MKKQRKSALLQIRIEAELRDRLRQLAKRKGIGVSKLVRETLRHAA